MLAPHESSQAHGERIRTSGFYLPFLFFFSSPAKSRLGVKSVRCHMTATHTVRRSLVFAFSQFHLVGFHVPAWPLKRWGKGRFFFFFFCGRSQLSHVNAASGWAASALTPGIPGLLKEREAEVQNSCRAPPKLRSTERTMENGQKRVSDQQIMIHVEISCVRPQKNVSGEVTLPKKVKENPRNEFNSAPGSV